MTAKPRAETQRPTAGAEELYSVAEVAALWKCSRQHVYDLIAKRALRKADIGIRGAQTRIPASALAEFIAARTAA
jgi:excisionase family DNA binding protein